MKFWAGNVWRVSIAGFLGFAVILGCAGSGIRTAIYENETSRVFLEWVPQDSFRASHPAILPPTVIRGVLGGLRVHKPQADLSELLTGPQQAKRILSDDDVELLIPNILFALSQATPEEQVVFQRIYPWEYGSRMTAGTLFLHEDLLFLTITHYTQKPGGINFMYVDDRQAPDPTGLGRQIVFFVPKNALRSDKSPGEPGHPDEVTLAIHYPLFETLQNPAEQSSSSQIRQTGMPSPDDSRDGNFTSGKKKAAHEKTASEDQALRTLEEQVHKQEQDLKQLKKDLEEIQRSRDSERQSR